jgi:ABC-type glutathione transport system ATPase component
MNARAVLEVEDLEVHYGLGRRRRRVLDGVSLTVSPGEAIGVIGETGSGKTTLARAVLGLVPFSRGRVVIDGRDVSKARARQWRTLRRAGVVQYVFQDSLRSLDPDLAVGKSLVEPLLIQGIPRAEADARARAFLNRVQLDADLLDRLPGALSGGQRQRVAVARALVNNPSMLLADEPTGALDTATGNDIMALFERLHQQGNTIVVVTHENDIALHAWRVIHIRDGKVERDEKIK